MADVPAVTTSAAASRLQAFGHAAPPQTHPATLPPSITLPLPLPKLPLFLSGRLCPTLQVCRTMTALIATPAKTGARTTRR